MTSIQLTFYWSYKTYFEKMQNTTTIIYVTHKYHMSCFCRVYGVYHIIKYEFIEKCDTFSTIISYTVKSSEVLRRSWNICMLTFLKPKEKQDGNKKQSGGLSRNVKYYWKERSDITTLTFHLCLLWIDKYRNFTNRVFWKSFKDKCMCEFVFCGFLVNAYCSLEIHCDIVEGRKRTPIISWW